MVKKTSKPKHPKDVALTPRIVLLAWACDRGDASLDRLAAAAGISPADVYALLSMISDRRCEIARRAT